MGTYIRLSLVALFWGGTFVAGRMVSLEVGPYAAAFIRFLLATLFLLPLMIREEGKMPGLSLRQVVALALLGLSGVFAYNALFFYGLQTVEAGRAALIIATNPVLIALFSFLLFGERFHTAMVVGVVLSVIGAVVVISRGDPLALLQGDLGMGELALLGCVLTWVFYTLLGKRVMTGLKPLTAVTYSCLAGVLALFPAAVQDDLFPVLSNLSLTSTVGLLYLAFFGTALGFVWFYRGVYEIGPTRAGQFINLVPVSAVLLGILILGEEPSLSLLGGGALIVTGMILTNRRRG